MQRGPQGSSPEEHGAEEAPVYGGLVHHDRVLLIVATVAGYGHNRIVTCWKFPAPPPHPSHLASNCHVSHNTLQVSGAGVLHVLYAYSKT